jgi:hypothetical protein
VLPASGGLDLMNPAAGPATPPTRQATESQAVNPNHHLLSAQFHRGHAVGFQSQHFPDKRFDQHLVSSPLVVFAQQRRVADSRCLSFYFASTELIDLQTSSNPSLFWESSPLIKRERR